MDRAIFQQALHATARVACAAALVGCVRNPPNASVDSATETESGTEDTSVDTGSTDTGTVDTGTVDTGTTDTGTVDTGVTDTGDPAMQECLDDLASQVGTDPADADIRDCCETVAVDWDFNSASGEVRMMCCELLDWDANNFPGCTPWGPPRPPSMGARLAAARQVRAVRAAALAGVA